MPYATTTRPEAKLNASTRAWRLSLVSGAVGLLVLGAALVTDFGASVVVRNADRRVDFTSPLPGSGEFEIEYVHSYYEVPATEHFVAGKDGSFELVEVSSPSEAVLDYYELEGRKEAGEDLLSLVPDSPQRFDELPLIGTEKGQRTLVVSGERFSLYEESAPRHVVVRVEEDTIFSELGASDGLRRTVRLERIIW